MLDMSQGTLLLKPDGLGSTPQDVSSIPAKSNLGGGLEDQHSKTFHFQWGKSEGEAFKDH